MCVISVSLWREHRLEETCEEALTIQTRFSSFEDYWSPFFEGQGPAGTYVAALAPSERDELRLRLRRRLIGEGADRRIVLGARALARAGHRTSCAASRLAALQNSTWVEEVVTDSSGGARWGVSAGAAGRLRSSCVPCPDRSPPRSLEDIATVA